MNSNLFLTAEYKIDFDNNYTIVFLNIEDELMVVLSEFLYTTKGVVYTPFVYQNKKCITYYGQSRKQLL